MALPKTPQLPVADQVAAIMLAHHAECIMYSVERLEGQLEDFLPETAMIAHQARHRLQDVISDLISLIPDGAPKKKKFAKKKKKAVRGRKAHG